MTTKPSIFGGREDLYDDVINKYIKLYNKEYGVIVKISDIKGIISQESSWSPTDFLKEPRLNDMSRGLMQILYNTATGIGYTGSADGLYDVETNIKYGMKYFYIQFKKYRKYTDAFASYNAGSPRRNSDGTYINQYYVDRVSNFATFYYYRDIVKDYDKATQKLAQINNKKYVAPEKSNTALYVVAVIVAILIIYKAMRG